LAGKSVNTDPDTYDELSQMVNDAQTDTEKKKARDKIDNAYLGNKLKYKDAETLRGRTKEDDPLKLGRSQRAFSELLKLRTSGVLEPDVYMEKSNTLSAWLKAKPNATDNELEDFYKVLTMKETTDWVGEILDTILLPVTFGISELFDSEKISNDKAIRILINAGKVVNEDTIKQVKEIMK